MSKRKGVASPPRGTPTGTQAIDEITATQDGSHVLVNITWSVQPNFPGRVLVTVRSSTGLTINNSEAHDAGAWDVTNLDSGSILTAGANGVRVAQLNNNGDLVAVLLEQNIDV